LLSQGIKFPLNLGGDWTDDPTGSLGAKLAANFGGNFSISWKMYCIGVEFNIYYLWYSQKYF